MDTVKMREEITQYLQQADERVLNLIHGLIKAEQATTAVEGKPYGTPISKEELLARAERSDRDIQNGRVKTAKQIREEMKNW